MPGQPRTRARKLAQLASSSTASPADATPRESRQTAADTIAAAPSPEATAQAREAAVGLLSVTVEELAAALRIMVQRTLDHDAHDPAAALRNVAVAFGVAVDKLDQLTASRTTRFGSKSVTPPPPGDDVAARALASMPPPPPPSA